MRHAFIPLALLTAGCWTPGPGEIDPTRYPWDQAGAQTVRGTVEHQPQRAAAYCVVSLERPSATGISAPAPRPDTRIVARGLVPPFEQVPPGGHTVELACKEPRR